MTTNVRDRPISPPPLRDARPDAPPAYLSNGLVGLRVGCVPVHDGLAVVEGLVGRDPVMQVEAFARAPYPAAGDVAIDGHRLSAVPGRARFVEQHHDFATGELTTRFTYHVGEASAVVDALTYCSRTQPTLVVQELAATVTRPCRLTLSGGLGTRDLAGRWLRRATRTPQAADPVVDGYLLWETHGAASTCGAAYVTEFAGPDAARRSVLEDDDLAPMRTDYTVEARPGRRYVLRQLASLVPSQAHSQPDLQALRLAAMGRAMGFETLRNENRRAWADIWTARIRLLGAADRWQAIADASFYYLQASAHASSVFSTAMFGLASWPNYHYYRGHVMWDVEAFAFPILLLTAPATARSLLSYRYERVAAARRNAALQGYGGLQFPWESGPIEGDEAYRVNAPELGFEQHVSFSVALAFARFAQVTGDREFLEREAWRVLKGVADWIESRAERTERGLEIKRVLGIAEKQAPVDNNAYVNMGASVVLREAAAAARLLGRPEAGRWCAMAGDMVLARDERTGAILNQDPASHPENEVNAATPEALAGMVFPFDWQAPPDVERATLRGQLDAVGPYVGRPMLSPLLGLYGARLGDRALSARLFEQGYAELVEGPYGTASELSPVRFPDAPRVGPLFAHVGGFLSACVIGLPGLRIDHGDPRRWPARPVVMPEGWDGVEVCRLWLRGRPARLTARHGDERATIEYLDDA